MNTVLGWVMNTDGTVRASRVVRNGSTGASSSTPAATNYVHCSIVALPQREAQQERDILQQQPLPCNLKFFNGWDLRPFCG